MLSPQPTNSSCFAARLPHDLHLLGGLLALAALIIILHSLMLGAQPERFVIRIATRETEVEQFKATCFYGEFESEWNMSLSATKAAVFDHLWKTGAIAVEFEVSE